MSRLYKFLLYITQYYNITYGFSYIYVNIDKRLLKFPIVLKIYVYFLNLMQSLIILYYYGRAFKEALYYMSKNAFMNYVFMIEVLVRMLIFLGNTMFHNKEEKFLKKYHNIHLKLQSDYIDKLSEISLNNILEIAQIIHILITLTYGLYTYYLMFGFLFNDNWEGCMFEYIDALFKGLERYVMFNHSVMLCYISYCISKLNKQLESGDIEEPYGRIYFKFSLLLDQVNILNSPMIFGTLFSQFLGCCSQAHQMFVVFLKRNPDVQLNYVHIFMRSILNFNMFFYFLICDRIAYTTRKTMDILREHITNNQNEEVCIGKSAL